MKASLSILVLMLGVAGPAWAGPASIADCEKISGADAYNYCLASFGPKRGQRAVSGASGRDPEANAPAFQRGKIGGRRNFHIRNVQSVFAFKRGKSGQMTMEFTVGSRAPGKKVTQR